MTGVDNSGSRRGWRNVRWRITIPACVAIALWCWAPREFGSANTIEIVVSQPAPGQDGAFVWRINSSVPVTIETREKATTDFFPGQNWFSSGEAVSGDIQFEMRVSPGRRAYTFTRSARHGWFWLRRDWQSRTSTLSIPGSTDMMLVHPLFNRAPFVPGKPTVIARLDIVMNGIAGSAYVSLLPTVAPPDGIEIVNGRTLLHRNGLTLELPSTDAAQPEPDADPADGRWPGVCSGKASRGHTTSFLASSDS
jgi:hypothetical protein